MHRVFWHLSELWQFSVSEPFSPPAASNAKPLGAGKEIESII
jgi:hypothetical protein